jgi:hypothetical protein
MIKEVDINGDGEISYSEFEKMMEQMIKWALRHQLPTKLLYCLTISNSNIQISHLCKRTLPYTERARTDNYWDNYKLRVIQLASQHPL